MRDYVHYKNLMARATSTNRNKSLPPSEEVQALIQMSEEASIDKENMLIKLRHEV